MLNILYSKQRPRKLNKTFLENVHYLRGHKMRPDKTAPVTNDALYHRIQHYYLSNISVKILFGNNKGQCQPLAPFLNDIIMKSVKLLR